MNIICKVKCPYNERGFCVRGLTAIDENGMCEIWWNKGQRRIFNVEHLDYLNKNACLNREKINIIEAKKYEYRDKQEVRDLGALSTEGTSEGSGGKDEQDGENIRDNS